MGLRRTVDQSIRHSNYNLNFLSIAAIIIGLVAFAGAGRSIHFPGTFVSIVGTSRYLIRSFSPTQTLTNDQVLGATVWEMPQFNVRITGTTMQDGGYKERSSKYGIVAYYGYLWINGKFLLVRSRAPINESVLSYTGTLELPSGVAKEIYDEIIVDYPDVVSQRLPWVLDLEYDPLPWYLGFAVELALVVGGTIGLSTAYVRRDPNEHPIMKNLARYGDVDKVINEIDADLKAGKIQKVYLLQFTRNWLIYKAGTDMQFMRYRDLMWMYEKTVTKRSRYGETVNHYLYIYERSGHVLTINAAEHKDVKRMLTALIKQAPWAETGYAPHLETAWRSDRAGFAQGVDARRDRDTPFV